MARQKVLAIGLDDFEVSLAERYIAEGQMPALAALRKRGRAFRGYVIGNHEQNQQDRYAD